jgi:hypothetical protein
VIPSPLTLTFSVLTPTKVGPTWSIVERGDTADWSIVERGDTADWSIVERGDTADWSIVERGDTG